MIRRSASRQAGICTEDCTYRQLYEGAQRSMSDLAARQAAALGRTGRLRNRVVMAAKKSFPRMFGEAERYLGRRLHEVEDEVLLAYVEMFFEEASRESVEGRVELARALAAAGYQVDPAGSLSQWAEQIARGRVVNPLAELFEEAGDPKMRPTPRVGERPRRLVRAGGGARTNSEEGVLRPVEAAKDRITEPVTEREAERAPGSGRIDPWARPAGGTLVRTEAARTPEGRGEGEVPAPTSWVPTGRSEPGTGSVGHEKVHAGAWPDASVTEEHAYSAASGAEPAAVGSGSGAAWPEESWGAEDVFGEESDPLVDGNFSEIFDGEFPETGEDTGGQVDDSWLEQQRTATDTDTSAEEADGVGNGAAALVTDAEAREAATGEVATGNAGGGWNTPARIAPPPLEKLFEPRAERQGRGQMTATTDTPENTTGESVEQAAEMRAEQPAERPDTASSGVAAAVQEHPGNRTGGEEGEVAANEQNPVPAKKTLVRAKPVQPRLPGAAGPGLRPELIVPGRTTQRREKKPVRTRALPGSVVPDVPGEVEPGRGEGVLDENMRARLLAASSVARPVFTSDLADLVGDARVVEDWLASWQPGDATVRFISPKPRHRLRGSLVIPADKLRHASAEFKRSWWGRCIEHEEWRGAKLYELAVVLHRFGEWVVSDEIEGNTMLLRLNLPQGLTGVLFAADTSFGPGSPTRDLLIMGLEKLMSERLVHIAVLCHTAEGFEALSELIPLEARARGWAPHMPVTLSKSWEFANSSGAAVPVLG